MTQTEIKPEAYQQALHLAEIGQHSEALSGIQSYLATAPEDAEALNDKGTLLWCLGRSDEAIDHLERARRIQPEAGEILWNLFEIYVATEQGQEATTLLDDMESLNLLSADALNRTARVLIDQDKLEEALILLERSLALSPQQPILKPIMEVVRHKRGKTPTESALEETSGNR
jgi:tetratricopeptide (TPR) repeat protein